MAGWRAVSQKRLMSALPRNQVADRGLWFYQQGSGGLTTGGGVQAQVMHAARRERYRLLVVAGHHQLRSALCHGLKHAPGTPAPSHALRSGRWQRQIASLLQCLRRLAVSITGGRDGGGHCCRCAALRTSLPAHTSLLFKARQTSGYAGVSITLQGAQHQSPLRCQAILSQQGCRS